MGDDKQLDSRRWVPPHDGVIQVGNIQMSANCGNLFKAIAQAQARIKHPAKTRTVKTAQYSYTYADLPDVIDAFKAELSHQGVAFIQGVSCVENAVSVTSMLGLGSKDGTEYLASTLTLKAAVSTPQGVGSATTYARRYGASALVNISADEDDDGAAGSKHDAAKPARNLKEELKNPGPLYQETLDQKKYLAQLALNQINLTDQEILKRMSSYCKGKPLSELEQHMAVFIATNKA